MDSKMASLEAKLSPVIKENKNLKLENKAKDKIIEDLISGYSNLTMQYNDLQQYNGSWSVGVFNIPPSEEEEKDG
jgi:hypothetical protein